MGDTRNVGRISPAALWFHVTVAVAVLLGVSVVPVLCVSDVARYAAIATGPTVWSGQEVEFPLVTAGLVWLTARWGATSLLVVLVTCVGGTVAVSPPAASRVRNRSATALWFWHRAGMRTWSMLSSASAYGTRER